MDNQVFIKLNSDGVPELKIETNDPTLQLPGGDGVYIDVSDAPRLQDINKFKNEFTPEIIKDKNGELVEIRLRKKVE